jgi:PAS domain S-box-containing protein
MANRSYLAMTGFAREDLVGAEGWCTIHPDDREAARAAIDRMRSRGRSEVEVRGLRKDGTVFHKQVVLVAIHDGTGAHQGHYRFTKDITERRREELLRRHLEELERSNRELERTRREQLRMKDRFISHVSHELRSPLTVIHDFVTILEDGIAGDLSPTQAEYVEIMRRNVDQLVGMIGDLLDVTRAQTGKLALDRKCLALGDVLQQAVDSFRGTASARSIQLDLETAADLPYVYGDGRRVRQILDNLIGNALKFIESDTGRIRVTARRCDRDAEMIEVAVQDTGRGIAPEHLDRIFESLYQASPTGDIKRQGLGLGLFITRDLVARHGGRLTVESQLGEGSTFRFTIPVFSIPRVIADAIHSQPVHPGTFALIHLEVGPADSRPIEPRDEERLAEVHATLHECLDGERGTILPRVPHGTAHETFLVLVRDGSHAARNLSDRMLKSLSDRCGLTAAGLRVNAYVNTLDPASLGPSTDERSVVARENEIPSGSAREPDIEEATV